ncbi:hypothetical protein CAI16_14265 [Virgibacillus dokdonensis]|uniref:Uncharacterized protein n=2 Tax=Virgibacillus TaxID=84406 RepID=A0A1M5SK37_9BACI|nr:MULTISPECIES: hypothetical protein [Virgibacillus]RFA33631.1 hypothetical protein CAI16_14265 [Virgibacillus dokdonensis]SHH38859.1 hypothetical protein SAMN05421807_106211 [Virgibacillus chiguensis]
MIQSKGIIPRISFKGVFVFMSITILGLLLFPTLFMTLGITKTASFFIACTISSSIGSMLVLTKIDGKPTERIYFRKRMALSMIVGLLSSALIIFVFGGDIFGY